MESSRARSAMHRWCSGWWLLSEQIGRNVEPGASAMEFCNMGYKDMYVITVLHKSEAYEQGLSFQSSCWGLFSICLVVTLNYDLFHGHQWPQLLTAEDMAMVSSKPYPCSLRQLTSGFESNVLPVWHHPRVCERRHIWRSGPICV